MNFSGWQALHSAWLTSSEGINFFSANKNHRPNLPWNIQSTITCLRDFACTRMVKTCKNPCQFSIFLLIFPLTESHFPYSCCQFPKNAKQPKIFRWSIIQWNNQQLIVVACTNLLAAIAGTPYIYIMNRHSDVIIYYIPLSITNTQYNITKLTFPTCGAPANQDSSNCCWRFTLYSFRLA